MFWIDVLASACDDCTSAYDTHQLQEEGLDAPKTCVHNLLHSFRVLFFVHFLIYKVQNSYNIKIF